MNVLPTQIAASQAAGVPPVDVSRLPADVRRAGPKAEQLYQTALAFEQVLLGQLTQELQATTGATDGSSGDDGTGDGSGDGSTDSSSSVLMQMLPQAFAQGMTSAGGVGIARELYDALKAQAGITSTGAGAG